MKNDKRSHLSRLESICVEFPIYFITTCTHKRKPILSCDKAFEVIKEVFNNCEKLYGWLVGRFVLMPDHVHFFCAAKYESRSLEFFVGKFKEWSAKAIMSQLDLTPPIWQKEFRDHLLRSDSSYDDKWNYVRDNPVRAGLVEHWSDWKYSGEIHPIEF